MKTTLLMISLAALVSLGGPSLADDEERGRGGPPPRAGRDDDRREYLEGLAERQGDDARRFEERAREDARRLRRAGRDDDRGRDFDDSRRDRVRQASFLQGILGGLGGIPPYGPGPGYGAAPPVPYRADVYPPGGLYGGRPSPHLPGPGYDGFVASGPYRGVPYALPPGGADIPYADEPYPTRYIVPAPEVAPPAVDPVPALADQLAGQAEAFLQAFRTRAGVVPQWARFMADATALRDAAARFRDVAAVGADFATLRLEFRPVAARWRRLESRMARVSKGHVGPNIATALEMGRTVEQIGGLLP